MDNYYPLKVRKPWGLIMESRVSSSCNFLRHIRRFKLLILDSQSNVFVKLYLQYVTPRINLGQVEMISKGRRCRVINICSRVSVGLIG